MTRTGIFVALTLACCAAELRAQMAYPYISPPGLGSRGGRMSSYSRPTYTVPTYSTYSSPVIYGPSTVTPTYGTIITPSYGTPVSPTTIGGTTYIRTTGYTPGTTVITGTTTSPMTYTPTITSSGTIISPAGYTPVISTSPTIPVTYGTPTSGTYFTRVRGGIVVPPPMAMSAGFPSGVRIR